MFLLLGTVAALTVLALCIDTIDIPDISEEQFARFVLWRQRCQKGAMKFAFRNVLTGKFVSSWDAPHMLIANRDAIGPGETFELIDLDPPPPAIIDPIDGTWPPPVGTPRVRPPDVATTDPTECLRQLRWALWVADSSDNESGWMGYIFDTAGEGHAKGWTSNSYWADKIAAGDGAYQGYAWPAQ